MKKRNIITNLILIIALMMVVYVHKPRSILQDIGKVKQISIYNIGSKESVDIVDENEINNYVNRWKQMIVKKEKIVGNSSSKGLVVILYDENGDTIDTIYMSEENLIYHHWLVQIIDGINPYKELMLKFQDGWHGGGKGTFCLPPFALIMTTLFTEVNSKIFDKWLMEAIL